MADVIDLRYGLPVVENRGPCDLRSAPFECPTCGALPGEWCHEVGPHDGDCRIYRGHIARHVAYLRSRRTQTLGEQQDIEYRIYCVERRPLTDDACDTYKPPTFAEWMQPFE